ncbi:hypothetical protein Acor_08550 [Acrocarpospora corrugata]|uniref:Uncharacterized protein n=2 Tax=Acrocarpospora corrugata TaxID=35763 RepID=A0A5M3VT44_9ACTN|nr:hypothetical protein Acor_08550 [Acrocarpospora corrugata]
MVPGFAGGLRRRVEEARAASRAAKEADDLYAVQAHTADLEDLLRLAEEHGVSIEPEEE